MIPDVDAVGHGAYQSGEAGDYDRRDNGLDLDEGDVSDDHLQNFTEALHVAQVGLRAQSRGKAHIQISLETQESRYQDEDFRHLPEDLPFLLERQDFKKMAKFEEDTIRSLQLEYLKKNLINLG